jgi:hypothetical protein
MESVLDYYHGTMTMSLAIIAIIDKFLKVF